MLDVEIETASGILRGFEDDDLVHWRGVPYAAAPIGAQRFRAPRPHSSWRGVRDASSYGAVAPQKRTTAAFGVGRRTRVSEDCLTLNITAPRMPADAPRPVMVFIHGGANTLGTGSVPLYDGVELVRRGDIVYVSINYRLGVLGFMDFSAYSTADQQFDSNLGLRDQVAALQWIHDNIGAFGGDPERITVFGESAGAMAVTALMATPAAHGLFARAIAQSSAPALVNSRERSAHLAADFLEMAGIRPTQAPRQLLSVEPSHLVQTLDKLTKKYAADQPGLNTVALTVDGDYLPKQPVEAFADGTATQVPLIIGTNRREAALFAKLGNVLPTTPALIDKLFSNTDPDALGRVTAAYAGYPSKRSAIALGGDHIFWWPSVLVADGHSAHAPTYVYRYDYGTRFLRMVGLGATHGIELFAVFGKTRSGFARVLTSLGGGRGFEEVGSRMRDHWLLFARTGHPGTDWPAYTVDDRKTAIFKRHDVVVTDPHSIRREAWTGYRNYR